MALWFYTAGLAWLLLSLVFSDATHLRSDFIIGGLLIGAAYLCEVVEKHTRFIISNNKD